MKKLEIARRLARQSGISQAAAADELDRVVHRILTNLRKGRDTPVPGLGVFAPGPDGSVLFHPEKDAPDERR
jgi:nucleoid DNA-binding protein